MYDFIIGTVKRIYDNAISLQSGSLGFYCLCTKEILKDVEIDKEITIYTNISIHNDLFMLYAFNDREERELFCKLIKISGVGSKMAFNILSYYSYSEIIDIFATQNIVYLSKINGIGKKVAERILFYVKDIFKVYDVNIQNNVIFNKVNSALVGLGYPNEKNIVVLKELIDLYNEKKFDFDLILRESLKRLNTL